MLFVHNLIRYEQLKFSYTIRLNHLPRLQTANVFRLQYIRFKVFKKV